MGTITATVTARRPTSCSGYFKSSRSDLNRGHHAYQACALTRLSYATVFDNCVSMLPCPASIFIHGSGPATSAGTPVVQVTQVVPVPNGRPDRLLHIWIWLCHQCAWKELNLRHLGLQPSALPLSYKHIKWRRRDLNPRPSACKAGALPD